MVDEAKAWAASSGHPLTILAASTWAWFVVDARADRRSRRGGMRRRVDGAVLVLEVDLAEQAGGTEVLVVGQHRQQTGHHRDANIPRGVFSTPTAGSVPALLAVRRRPRFSNDRASL